MSLFRTTSSSVTVGSADNYITFTPCQISPSLLNRKAEIFQLNQEINSDSNSSLLNSSLDDYYHNSSNKIHKRVLNFNVKRIGSRLTQSKQQLNSRKYEQENYENTLIKHLIKSKNDSEALNVMSKLWKSIRFCDLIIMFNNSSGIQYLAHRIVLALYSPKYRAYFRQHKYDFVTKITLKETKPRALQQILKFLYLKEEIRFNIKTIDSIFTCVRELDLTKLQETCEKSLYQFEKKYIFDLVEIASKHGLKQLYAEAYLYICLNFNECIRFSSFLNAPFRFITELLEKNTIRNKDEGLLLQRLVDWITKNKEFVNRNPDVVPRLLRNINYSKIDIKNLKHDKESIFQVYNCEHIFNEALRIPTHNKTIKERTLSADMPARNSRRKELRIINADEFIHETFNKKN